MLCPALLLSITADVTQIRIKRGVLAQGRPFLARPRAIPVSPNNSSPMLLIFENAPKPAPVPRHGMTSHLCFVPYFLLL